MSARAGDKPFVSLSTKSLKTAYAWAEENEDKDPLAHTYMLACQALGAWDENTYWRVPPAGGAWVALGEANRLFFEARDRVGRVVLQRIKRDGAAK